MTETVLINRIVAPTISNGVYESTLTAKSDIQTMINTIDADGTNHNRALTFKDLIWKNDQNVSPAAYDRTYTTEFIRSTKNDDNTKYILNMNKIEDRTAEDTILLQSRSLELEKYGINNIAYIWNDSAYSNARQFICSRTTGLWCVWYDTTNSVWKCNRIFDSHPCCYLFDDTVSSSRTFIHLANNECFDNVGLSTSSDGTTTYNLWTGYKYGTINSTNHLVLDTLEVQVVVSGTTETRTVSDKCLSLTVDGGSSVCECHNYTRTADYSNNTSLASGYKTITYTGFTTKGGSVNCYIKITIFNYKCGIQSGTSTPTPTWTIEYKDDNTSVASTYSFVLRVPSGNMDTRVGGIWWSHTIIFAGGNNWTFPNLNTSSGNGLYLLPSLVSGDAGSNLGSSLDANMYYFGTDDFNDYCYSWEMIDDSTHATISHGNDFNISPYNREWAMCMKSFYNTRETSTTSDDLWVLCSQVGIGVFQGNNYAVKSMSGLVNGSSLTDFAICVVQISGSNSKFEYAFDSVNKTLVGLRYLTDSWYGSTGSEWTGSDCTYYDINDTTTVLTRGIPAFVKVFDNNSVIFAVGADASLWYANPSTNASSFYRILDAFLPNLSAVDGFVYSTSEFNDVIIVANSGSNSIWIRAYQAGAITSTSTQPTEYVDAYYAYMRNATGLSRLITTSKMASKDNFNYMLAIDNDYNVSELTIASGTPAEYPTEPGIVINGMIKSPTIEDLYNKVYLIRSAMGISFT